MRRLSETVAQLAALRTDIIGGRPGLRSDRLKPLEAFGSNPGNLGAWYHVPESAPGNIPLVVVLHGCTQNAGGYDRGAGWSELADEQGFAVLLPEQRSANNANLCFNWFEPADTKRGGGEPLSIIQMIESLVAREGLDPAQVYITGLSAGGAMTSVMLATYPEIFAGGAIVAGLPYGSAHGVSQALERMRGLGMPSSSALAAAVRAASPHQGPWPRLSVWHGGADRTVSAANADAILAQWAPLLGVPETPPLVGQVDGHPHRVWRDASGRAVLEDYRITGLGHGTPLALTGEDRCGAGGAFLLEAGISSTRHIARFWGIEREYARRSATPGDSVATAGADNSGLGGTAPRRPQRPAPPPAGSGPGGVTKVIEDALRAAGLMK
jgi:poly(hydroxyalkanoate) depolymerase family esterase